MAVSRPSYMHKPPVYAVCDLTEFACVWSWRRKSGGAPPQYKTLRDHARAPVARGRFVSRRYRIYF